MRKSGIYDFLSQFGHAESKNGGYQKYFLRLDLLIVGGAVVVET